MVFVKSSISHVSKRVNHYVPSRRSVLSACTAFTLFAVPAGFGAASAVSSNPAAASVSVSNADAGTGHAKPAQAAKPASTKPANAAAAPKAPAHAQPAAHASAAAPAPVAKHVVAKPADPYAGVNLGQLEPSGLYGYQEHFTPNSDQWQNAKTIVQVAKRRSMSPYAAVIAVAVAMQESSLHNLTRAVDADSLGLFQQRPSMGWGSSGQLTDPAYATAAFLSALTQYAPGYGSMPLWQAAQDTQRSGYPTAYARWEDQAAHMVETLATG